MHHKSKTTVIAIAYLLIHFILPIASYGSVLDTTAPKEDSYVKGEVIVKFKTSGPNSVNDSVITSLNQNKSLITATSDQSTSLDKITKKLKVRSARKLFKMDTKAEISKAQKGTLKKGKKRLDAQKYVDSLKSIENVTVMDIDPAVNPTDACAQLNADSHVEYCQPNYKVTTFMVPNDPYYGSSGAWGQSYRDMWGLQTLQADRAWDTVQGHGVVVAVVDSGVDYNHPDLAANIWKNTAEIPNNGIDDDGNGYIDDVYGWNFDANNNNPMDAFGHGTHCAGTIAAIGNNNIGVIGVAPKAKIMALKGLSDDGTGYVDNLANGIIYAAQNGADVISNSWGCGNCPINPIAEDAVRTATALGSVVVFAAGNASDDVQTRSPQNMMESKPIVVSAIDQNNARTYFSSYGNLVDIAAPGGGLGSEANGGLRNILSLKSSICQPNLCPSGLIVGTNYLRLAGTSMATPHVAGLLALLVEKYPTYSVTQLKKLLYGNSSAFPAAQPVPIGFGVANANAAVNDSNNYIVTRIYSPKASDYVKVGQNSSILGTASAKSFGHYEISVGQGTNPTSWQTTGITIVGGEVIDGKLGTWTPSADGDWTVRLVVFSSNGTSKETRLTVSVFPNQTSGWPVNLGNPSMYNPEWQILASNLVAKDLNHDGKQELIFTLQNPFTYLNVIQSDGSMAAGFPLLISAHLAQSIAVGNVDNDPTDEEIVLYTRTTIYVFKKDGTPVAGWPKPIGDTSHLGTDPLALADLDGDGKLDIIVEQEVGGYATGVKNIFAYHGDGSLVSGWPQTLQYPVTTNLSVGDLDGDGKSEIIAYNFMNNRQTGANLYAWHGNGTPVAGFPLAVGPAWSFQSSTAVGDVDGDGKQDIIIRNGAALDMGSISVYDGQGRLKTGWPRSVGYNYQFTQITLADLDNDGASEIIVSGGEAPSYMDSIIHVFKSNGQEMPGWPVNAKTLFGGGNQLGLIVNFTFADVNGDGQKEALMTLASGSEWWVRTLDKNGQVMPNYDFKIQSNTYNPQMLLTDLDYNGSLDIVALTLQNVGGYLNLWNLPGEYNPALVDWPMVGNNSQQTTSLKLFENSAPVLNSIPAQSIPAGQRLSVTLQGNDPDGHQIVYKVVGALPTGATINGGLLTDVNHDSIVNNTDLQLVTAAVGSKNSIYDINADSLVDQRDVSMVRADLNKTNINPGLFQWTPNQAGSTSIDFAVQDGKLTSPPKTMVVNVTSNNTNHAPVLNPISDKTVDQGQLLSFTVSGTDPDLDPLTYSASNLPSGASFNTSTRTFSWTPAVAGNYSATFTVSDGLLSDSKTVAIKVNRVNGAPVLNPISDKTVDQGVLLSFTVSGTDPDLDPLTYSASNLPSGASFNTSTRTFSWTPAVAGNYSATFTVSDGLLSDSKTVAIKVNRVNGAPVLNPISDKTVDQGMLLSFTVSGTDPDLDPLTYSASNLPSGASFNTSTRTFSWTPAVAGNYSATFTVSDGTLSDSKTVAIKVNRVNHAPVLNPIGDKTVDQGQLLSFTVSGTDPDNDPLTYSASNLPSGASFNTSTRTFSWTPTVAGDFSATFTVSDGLLSDSKTVAIKVNRVNHAPVLNPISDKTVDQGVLLSFTVSGTDPDLDPLTYSASNLPSGASFNTSTRTFSWTPAVAGNYSATFTVSDGLLSDSKTVAIKVNRVNGAPVLNPISDKTVDQGMLLSFTVSGTDPDLDPLTYSASNLPSGASFNTSTRTFSWTPAVAGNYSATFTVSDGTLSDSKTVAIKVNRVNHAPVLNPIADKTVDQGMLLSFTVSGTDPDLDPLTYSASNLPSGASFNTSSRTFNWTPTVAGNYSATFKVSDGLLSDSKTVAIVVKTTGFDLAVQSVKGQLSVSPPLRRSEVNQPLLNINVTSRIINYVGISPATKVGLYLSKDANITTSDIFIGSSDVPSLNSATSGVIDINSSKRLDRSLPNGTYYVGAIVNYENNPPENITNNNSAAGNLIVIRQ